MENHKRVTQAGISVGKHYVSSVTKAMRGSTKLMAVISLKRKPLIVALIAKTLLMQLNRDMS